MRGLRDQNRRFDAERRAARRRVTIAIVVVMAGAAALVVWGIDGYPRWMDLHGVAFGAACAFGVVFGASELASRYRDEPFKAINSGPGWAYVLFNAAVSGGTYVLLVRYQDTIFPGLADDRLLLSLVAGFGAMSVLRSKFFTLTTEDGTEVAVGPEAAVESLLRATDAGVDRARARRRLALVHDRSSEVDADVDGMEDLEVALAALQNLSSRDRAEFIALTEQIERSTYPPYLKLQAVCYALLNLTGEKNFDAILTNLQETSQRRKQGSAAGMAGAPSV